MIKIDAGAVSDVAVSTKERLLEALKCLENDEVNRCKTLLHIAIARMETVEEIFDMAMSDKEGE